MKFIEVELRNAGCTEPLAYYHAHWTRATAPLLDELGAVLDHVNAFSAGGTSGQDNLVTACCKCNGRKSNAPVDEWNRRPISTPIKGKFGEPLVWDGLSNLFMVLAERNRSALTQVERDWLTALKQPSPLSSPSR
jgi:hypothetical protein